MDDSESSTTTTQKKRTKTAPAKRTIGAQSIRRFWQTFLRSAARPATVAPAPPSPTGVASPHGSQLDEKDRSPRPEGDGASGGPSPRGRAVSVGSPRGNDEDPAAGDGTGSPRGNADSTAGSRASAQRDSPSKANSGGPSVVSAPAKTVDTMAHAAKSLRGKSLCLFSSSSRLRQLCALLMKSKYFDNTVLLLIVISSVALAVRARR